jgi:8-hydroxy-5-deazaflavin:NADPH oxidoreductase
MKIAVWGTGMVGDTIGSRLIELGHEVMMGSRSATNEKAAEFVKKNGSKALQGTFADAAAFGEYIVNCTHGVATLSILESAQATDLTGKVFVDISNPLDFSKGMPPTLSVVNTSSLAEEIQATFPDLKVVKTLNTMWCGLMVNPVMLANGDHDVFLSGNDADAKAFVTEHVLKAFGWADEHIYDLGDVTTARGTEMLLPLWLRVWGATGVGAFNFKIVK